MNSSRAEITAVKAHGIDCYRLSAHGASALVSRFGAHVLSWRTADGRERLFLSERAVFDGVTPIRGGVPVCWPQFAGLGLLPKHGLVRTRIWQADVGADGADTATLRLHLGDDEETRALWPHAFAADLSVSLGPESLEIGIGVRNTGTAAFEFTAALHTYFAVGDIANVALHGLKGSEYRDAAGADAIRIEEDEAVRFAAEVDRVYHHAPTQLMLAEGERTMKISANGFPDAVVWNPGATRCAALPDMAPDGYRRMVCVEAAAARIPVRLPGGAAWRGSQVLAAA